MAVLGVLGGLQTSSRLQDLHENARHLSGLFMPRDHY